MLNYSVEIWGNYNKVEKKLISNIEGLNKLITLFMDKYNILKNYNISLDKLSNNKLNVTNLDSLSEGILSLKADIVNQYNYLNEYLTCIKEEIINPLQSEYQILIKKTNNISAEMSSIYKTYNASLNQLELSKNRFHASLKEAEQIKVTIEYYKIKLNNIQNNKNFNLNEYLNNINDYMEIIQEEEMKLDNIFNTTKEKERIYINLINYTNKLQEEYIETKNKSLNQIQNLEEHLGITIKDTLRKFVLFQLAYLRNTQYDINKNVKIIESINIKNDINNFIFTNKTEEIPPEKIKYEPYISYLGEENKNNETIKLGSINKETINEIQKFIKSIFPLEKTTEIEMKNKTQTDLEILIQKILNNQCSESERDSNINKIISNKKLRRILLNEINKYFIKNKENNILNDKTCNIIYEILKKLLNKLQFDNDFESANIILNFPNTLKINNEINFYNNIKNEEIFRNFEFWKEIIKYNIINERRQNKIREIQIEKKYSSVNENEIKKIAKNKLNIFVKYMMEFKCSSLNIKQIIQEFGEYYQLEKSFIDDYISKIKDYENLINKKKENTNNNNTNIGTNNNSDNYSSDEEEDNIINEEDLFIDKIE